MIENKSKTDAKSPNAVSHLIYIEEPLLIGPDS